MAAKVATKGLTPLVIKVTATAPPNGKEPSVVISGKSRIRKVIKIPKPRMAQIKPCETIELIIVSPFDNNSFIVTQIWKRAYKKFTIFLESSAFY